MPHVELMNESIYKHLVHIYDSIDDRKRRIVDSFSTQKHCNWILVGLIYMFEDT